MRTLQLAVRAKANCATELIAALKHPTRGLVSGGGFLGCDSSQTIGSPTEVGHLNQMAAAFALAKSKSLPSQQSSGNAECRQMAMMFEVESDRLEARHDAAVRRQAMIRGTFDSRLSVGTGVRHMTFVPYTGDAETETARRDRARYQPTCHNCPVATARWVE